MKGPIAFIIQATLSLFSVNAKHALSVVGP